MDFNRYSQISKYSREELLHIIGHSLEQLSDAELESVYYDMLTKDYIKE